MITLYDERFKPHEPQKRFQTRITANMSYRLRTGPHSPLFVLVHIDTRPRFY
jgi:hypothetical protein